MQRRQAFALLTASLLISACGGGEPDDGGVGPDPSTPVATSISLLPQQRTLESLGDTVRFSWIVRDQNGQGLPNTPTFTSSDPGVVSMGAAGDATAVSNGTATITAAVGSASSTASITVAQEVTQIEVLGGNGQSGIVGEELPSAVRVKLRDANGFEAPGQPVSITISEGGGTIGAFTGVSDGFGNVEVTWTAGNTAGLATMTVTAGGETEEIWANIIGRSDLSIAAIETSPVNPAVNQEFRLGVYVTNNGEGVNLDDVNIQVLLDGEEFTTGSSGAIQAGATTLIIFDVTAPAEAGTKTVSVTLDPFDSLEEIDEDNNSSEADITVVDASPLELGVPLANLTGTAGTQQAFTVEVSPNFGNSVASFDVALTGGTGNPDLYVRFGAEASTAEFDCSSTAADGEETCSIANPESGTYHLLVDGVADFTGGSLEASITEEETEVDGFDIELVFTNGATPAQREIFEAAEAVWEAAITAELQDVTFHSNPFPANSCAGGQREIVDVVDDVRIFVELLPIDGPGGVLASAGPCSIRGSNDLSVLGAMTFDTDDLSNPEQLRGTIIHEMGHVLGIGTLWTIHELLVNQSSATQALDTHFIGELTIAAFDDAGGTGYTGGEKVPVHNTDGAGSRNGHWRENVMDRELMTPFIDSGTNPLSAISLQSLADLGYTIDLSVADEYNLPGTSGAPPANPQVQFDLSDDIRTGPIYVVDPDGRIVGIIRQ